MSNVLVMFQTDTEPTEQMALAVGVGAVEAKASIRLRQLAAPGAVEVTHKGYGKLQAADLLWTVVIGLESPTPRTEELGGLLSLLSEIGPGELNGKQAWTFNPEGLIAGTSEAQNLVESGFASCWLGRASNGIWSAGSQEDMIRRMKTAGRSLASKSL